MTGQFVFLIHFATTFAMVGIMWFVQLAYYPNLAVVGRKAFVTYQREHIRRITGIAWTMLVLELATALAVAFLPPPDIPRWLLAVNVAILLSIWYSTCFVQVPVHQQVEQCWDAAAHARLVETNWFRTAAYTVRGALLLYAAVTLWTALTPAG